MLTSEPAQNIAISTSLNDSESALSTVSSLLLKYNFVPADLSEPAV